MVGAQPNWFIGVSARAASTFESNNCRAFLRGEEPSENARRRDALAGTLRDIPSRLLGHDIHVCGSTLRNAAASPCGEWARSTSHQLQICSTSGRRCSVTPKAVMRKKPSVPALNPQAEVPSEEEGPWRGYEGIARRTCATKSSSIVTPVWLFPGLLKKASQEQLGGYQKLLTQQTWATCGLAL